MRLDSHIQVSKSCSKHFCQKFNLDKLKIIVAENVEEYTKDPCKLITKLKEKYKDEFKVNVEG